MTHRPRRTPPRRRLAGATVLLGCLALASPPARADLNVGVSAYRRGDFAAALEHITPAARDGSAEAQFYLGRMYAQGEGVEPDPTVAAGWYRSAAAQGHALAQNNLGVLLEGGRGVAADAASAASHYRLAAESGLAVAQSNLARLYAEGNGVARDDTLAAEWYARAARQGHARAQLELGLMYREGRGVPADEGRANKWLRKAARQGQAVPPADAPSVPPDDEPVVAAVDDVSAPVDPVSAPLDDRPTVTPLPGSPSHADWLHRAEAGDVEAQLRLAEAYDSGSDGVPADADQAVRWYLAAARQGESMAWYRLGFVHLRGRGPSGKQDYVGAYQWFSLAAAREFGDAQAWLDRIARKMSREEIARGRTLAEAWRDGTQPGP